MNEQRFQTGLYLVGVGLVAAWGQLIPLCFKGRLPQSPGEDVVALVLGDARLAVSLSLEEKADEYFHGGVRHVNCSEGVTSQKNGVSTTAPATNSTVSANADHADHDEPECDAHHAAAAIGFKGWQWIDQRVHEQAHRHLKGAQAVELLPWFWAACRVSPKNSEAYESGAYVLAYMLDKPEEGVRLLKEGVRNNPAVPELDFMLGEVLFNLMHDAARAEPWFVSARAKCLPVQKKAERAEEVKLLRLRAVFYLGYLAKQRGDVEHVRACLNEAELLSPGHMVTRDLRALLKSAETKP